MATDMLNGWEFGVLVITSLTCALPVAVVCWSLVRVNLRLAEQNRDLMKAMLALTEKPQAAAVAGAMEITDREKVSPEPIARAYMARRPAGAG
jgi:hypothetical protein